MLKEEGITIDDIYYCPHHTEGVIEQYTLDCDCRKPKPKMLLNAARQHRIDLTQSVMIGDSEVDMLAGKNAGCTSILIRNGCTDSTNTASITMMDYVVKDLLEAARLFVRHKNQRKSEKSVRQVKETYESKLLKLWVRKPFVFIV